MLSGKKLIYNITDEPELVILKGKLNIFYMFSSFCLSVCLFACMSIYEHA